MIVLNKRKIPQYFQKISPNLDFEIKKIISCEEFDQYTNVNFIFKVKLQTQKGAKIIFLKQARSFNKRAKKQGHLVKTDPDRILGEDKLIRLLAKIWGKDFVPKIHYFDKKNKILIMSDVSQNGKLLLIEEFKNNRVHPELGVLFGNLFGKLHNSTYKTRENIAGSIKWQNRMLWLLNEYYGFGIKKFVPTKEFDDFFKESKNSPRSVIWNDAIYRNIFVKENSVSMVDFDHTINFDPAVDNGMLIAHWVWMMLKGDKKLEQDCRKFIQDYIKNYVKHLKNVPKKEINEILERTINWLAIYLVSRTDGKNGSYFKENPKWEQKIRQTGIDLFIHKDTPVTLKIKNLIKA